MILIDNYDSFTYNIVEYLRELGKEPLVFKNNEISIEELKKLNFFTSDNLARPRKPSRPGMVRHL